MAIKMDLLYFLLLLPFILFFFGTGLALAWFSGKYWSARQTPRGVFAKYMSIIATCLLAKGYIVIYFLLLEGLLGREVPDMRSLTDFRIISALALGAATMFLVARKIHTKNRKINLS